MQNSEKHGDAWAERSEHWINTRVETRRRRRRERNAAPLILCGHGMSLRIENGALVIRDGFTHYPQERKVYRFFPGDLELPPRLLLLDGSGTLSFDVLSWLGEQGVALVRVKWSGEIAIVASGTGLASDREKVCWQQETKADQTRRHSFASELISRKLEASIVTLEKHFAEIPARQRAIECAKLGLSRLAAADVGDMGAVYAIEGECAVAYFATWKHLTLRWTGTGRRAIPDDWRTYNSRSSLTSGKKPKNRLASHPLNAMLNYAYTVRQSQLHIGAVADGYDPTIGIMHNTHQGSAAFVLDLIEPERPQVDAVLLAFVGTHRFAAADFTIRDDGVCRLSPQLARAVAGLVQA